MKQAKGCRQAIGKAEQGKLAETFFVRAYIVRKYKSFLGLRKLTETTDAAADRGGGRRARFEKKRKKKREEERT